MIRDIADALAGLFLLCLDRARNLPDPLQIHRRNTLDLLNQYRAISGCADTEVAVKQALKTATIVQAHGVADDQLYRVLRDGLGVSHE